MHDDAGAYIIDIWRHFDGFSHDLDEDYTVY